MKHFGANFETSSSGFFRPRVGDPPENQAKEGPKFAARPAAVSKNEADVGKSTSNASPFFETQAHARLGIQGKWSVTAVNELIAADQVPNVSGNGCPKTANSRSPCVPA